MRADHTCLINFASTVVPLGVRPARTRHDCAPCGAHARTAPSWYGDTHKALTLVYVTATAARAPSGPYTDEVGWQKIYGLSRDHRSQPTGPLLSYHSNKLVGPLRQYVWLLQYRSL